MRLRWSVATAGLLMVLGAPSCANKSEDAGGAGVGIPLEQFCPELAGTLCGLRSRCACVDQAAIQLCVALEQDVCASSVAARVASGAAYDPNQAELCLQASASLECSAVAAGWPAACANVFTGRLPAGSRCGSTEQCLDGLGCRGGTCQVLPGEAQPCDPLTGCADGFRCVMDSGGYVCRPAGQTGSDCGMAADCDTTQGLFCAPGAKCASRLTEGADCQTDGVLDSQRPDPCAEGLRCDGFQCVQLSVSGMSCSCSSECAADLFCDPAHYYTCAPRIADQASCQQPDSCAAGSYCTVASQCVAPSGNACSDAQPCGPNAHCWDGACQPLPDEGEDCSLLDQCQQGLVCSTTYYEASQLTVKECLALSEAGADCCIYRYCTAGVGDMTHCTCTQITECTGPDLYCTLEADLSPYAHCHARALPAATCTNHQPCVVGYYCDGVCKPAGQAANCQDDTWCASTDYCANTDCAPLPSSGACAPGDRCADGFYCNMGAVPEPVCEAVPGPGDPCGNGHLCDAGSVCATPQRCLPGPGLGGPCNPMYPECGAGFWCPSTPVDPNTSLGQCAALNGADGPCEWPQWTDYCSSGAAVGCNDQTYCSQGACAARLANDEPCVPTVAPMMPESCLLGSYCAGAGICQPFGGQGSACLPSSGCGEGYYCSTMVTQNDVMGICQPLLGPGEQCTLAGVESNPCQAGLWCSYDGGTCESKLPAGSPCVYPDECISGDCSTGVCGMSGSDVCSPDNRPL
jgi:hypothetical protein